ncbi:MAG: LysR family transcriptional regulator [Ferrovum sp. 37-45-19]|uniref:LysR family transcriptional regulator n=1 Tax=Ferrovum sp. JA12 TaxID=1356299 RepID=UPI0007039C3C|nr:LysR family transcriptional regulator [Ferrovum sp. JA12]KRH79746.1 HTH-type transcriptional activator CmpR [Ferrovum sp. JA12]OYV94392.1 MAG: LysR family transcriptional regulator [Ferrovum sp. 37-45-19]OZB33235.1 MAG: LysR family transcriptional regulator [Ferrovum sp. 34-44-207]HQT80656.1 LysR family transcriptional regulator [Ferrovaceae bacterium]
MSILHATLHQLKIFDAVARHLSFARAAEELHLTPPALSIQVKQLADVIGQPLFEQIGKKISLTPTGDVAWAACRDVLERLEQLGQELAALQGLEKGSLKLATLATAKYFIPRLLGSFCTKHPGIDAALFMGNREELLKRIARNQDDIYILGQPPENINVISESFADNSLVIIASPTHPLAHEKNIPPTRLKGLPFILRESGSGTRLATENFFEHHGVPLKMRMELGSNEAVKQVVVGGLGIAVLSASTIHAELSTGELVVLDVKGFPLKRKWYMVYPAGKHLAPSTRVFMEYLLEANHLHGANIPYPKTNIKSTLKKKNKEKL